MIAAHGIRGLYCDGVWLMTRTGKGSAASMVGAVEGIAEMYQTSASETVRSIYEDDKHCAFYELRLVENMPLWIAKGIALEIRDLFRHLGGYNGMIIYHGETRLVDDDPWWDCDEHPYGSPA